MTYGYSLDIDTTYLEMISEVTPRVPELATQYFEDTVVPNIETEVDRVIAPYPPQRIPWGDGFATPKSRRWYFANKVEKGSKGGHYERTLDLMRAWYVRLDRRSVENFLRIGNSEPYAGHVYGRGNALSAYNQVPGHALTGWGDDFDNKFAAIEEYSIQQLFAAWNYMVEAILDGRIR